MVKDNSHPVASWNGFPKVEAAEKVFAVALQKAESLPSQD